MIDPLLIKHQTVSLEEVNSGMRDSQGFKKTLENVFNSFVDLTNKLPKAMKIQAIGKDKLKGTSDIYFYRKHATSGMDLQYKQIGIRFEAAENPLNEDKKIIYPYAKMKVYSHGHFEILVGVNEEANKREMLDKLDVLKLNVSHELVHIFKELYGQYQKDGDEFLTKDKKLVNWKKYLTDHSELEAFTSQIISELEIINKKNPDYTLLEALGESKSYGQFFEKVKAAYRGDFSEENFKDGMDKIIGDFKKKMLGKIVNFWKTEIIGKIK